MTFNGPLDYYFWQGIEAGFKGLDQTIKLPMTSTVARECELSYQDGYAIGEELTTRQFNLLTKPKVRLKAKRPLKRIVKPKNEVNKKIAEFDKELDEFNDEFNTDLRGNC